MAFINIKLFMIYSYVPYQVVRSNYAICTVGVISSSCLKPIIYWYYVTFYEIMRIYYY
jgi:hypothetical protein